MPPVYDVSQHPLLEKAVPSDRVPALTETAEALLGVNPQRVATDAAPLATIQAALVQQVNYLHFQGTLGQVLQSQGKTGANFRSRPSGEAPVISPLARELWGRVPMDYRVGAFGEPSRITAGRGPRQ